MVNNNEMECFLPGPSSVSDRKAIIEITKHPPRSLNMYLLVQGVLMECFHCRYSPSKPYQVPPGCIAYELQKLFKEKLERLQQQDIITPLGIDEMAE